MRRVRAGASKDIGRKKERGVRKATPAKRTLIVDGSSDSTIVMTPELNAEVPTQRVSLMSDSDLGVSEFTVTEADLTAVSEFNMLADMTVNVLKNSDNPNHYNIAVRIPGYECLDMYLMTDTLKTPKYKEIWDRLTKEKFPLSLVFQPSKKLAQDLLDLLRHNKKIYIKAPNTTVPTQPAARPLKKNTPPARSTTVMGPTPYMHTDARVIPKEAKVPSEAKDIFPGLFESIAGAPLTLTQMEEASNKEETLVNKVDLPPKVYNSIPSTRLSEEDTSELSSLFSQSSPGATTEPKLDFVDELVRSEETDKQDILIKRKTDRETNRKAHEEFLNKWKHAGDLQASLKNSLLQKLIQSISEDSGLSEAANTIYQEAVEHRNGIEDLSLDIFVQITVTERGSEGTNPNSIYVSVRNLVMD